MAPIAVSEEAYPNQFGLPALFDLPCKQLRLGTAATPLEARLQISPGKIDVEHLQCAFLTHRENVFSLAVSSRSPENTTISALSAISLFRPALRIENRAAGAPSKLPYKRFFANWSAVIRLRY